MSKKKYVILLLAALVSIAGLWQDKARAEATSSSETTVTGRVLPSLIKVSAPAKIIFTINPNAELKEQFISSTILIQNNSNAPVKVKISEGAQNFIQTNDSLWKPVDVLSDACKWNNIGTSDSESYLALGIKATGEGWRKCLRENPLYVKEQNNSKTSIEFGEIDSKASALLKLACSHGMSFSSEKECTYTIIWSFSLGE